MGPGGTGEACTDGVGALLCVHPHQVEGVRYQQSQRMYHRAINICTHVTLPHTASHRIASHRITDKASVTHVTLE